MRILVLIIASLSAILLFLLASASSNTTAMFDQYYKELVILNALLATGLAVAVVIQLYQLRKKVKNRVFGSRLTLRLTLTFGLVALLPGLLMYILSMQFLMRSIETWFDVRVETALERGLNLGQRAIEYSLQDLARRAQLIAQQLNETNDDISVFAHLADIQHQFRFEEIALFSLEGKLLAHLATNPSRDPTYPTRGQLQQAEYQTLNSIEVDATHQRMVMRVIVPIHVSAFTHQQKVLQIIDAVPTRLATDAEVVEKARNEYLQLTLSRDGLKWMYSLTLTLAFLVLMLGVFMLAIYLSNKLSAPLSVLAAGTKAVAQGDFSQQQPIVSRDELGILTHSFNQMTRQLAEARKILELKQAEQAAAKNYLETILDNMTAGVLSFDENWLLRSSNDSAARILQCDIKLLITIPLPQWEHDNTALAPFCHAIYQGFANNTDQHWQQQIELHAGNTSRVLLIHCAHLQKQYTEDKNSGYIIVFDDITKLISAQRDAAWREVARRLAHEIKNPLTPIHLAAERLQHKLYGKLTENDADFLGRSTKTIISQVHALKNMVDAFKEYARQPSATMQRVDFTTLLKEVLVLYENMPLTIEMSSNAPLWINGDVTLLRQVIHNLLQNAQDAVANHPNPHITIKTEQHTPYITFTVADNGDGFPESILPRIFEPYATTKAKGTGLGLAIVKKIVEEHQGHIQVGNQPTRGAFVRIDLPCWEEMGEQQ